MFRACGPAAADAFKDEAGGHRWQRIPPNEKHGRVHTSTVTVAVLREPAESEVALSPQDLRFGDGEVELKFTRGSGPGGQHRNKVESVVVLTHKPTGITVRCETERSQHQNRQLAMGLLRARILERRLSDKASQDNALRRAMVGSGMRSDKIRTIRCQDGIVTNNKTGTKARLRDYLNGDLSIARLKASYERG